MKEKEPAGKGRECKGGEQAMSVKHPLRVWKCFSGTQLLMRSSAHTTTAEESILMAMYKGAADNVGRKEGLAAEESPWCCPQSPGLGIKNASSVT